MLRLGRTPALAPTLTLALTLTLTLTLSLTLTLTLTLPLTLTAVAAAAAFVAPRATTCSLRAAAARAAGGRWLPGQPWPSSAASRRVAPPTTTRRRQHPSPGTLRAHPPASTPGSTYQYQGHIGRGAPTNTAGTSACTPACTSACTPASRGGGAARRAAAAATTLPDACPPCQGRAASALVHPRCLSPPRHRQPPAAHGPAKGGGK